MSRATGGRPAAPPNRRSFLRHASEAQLRRIALASPQGEAHMDRLREWVAEAARHGYAVCSSEWDEGLTAVTGRSGAVIASLSLSGPSQRFSYEVIERFATALGEAARLISDQGFSHPLSPGL
ncbi:IclR family transcriptional regulator C-terminal domain-containing protein [Streptomyces sp. NPDC001401]|uniref:IclR family transcriptional regulator domain-containing protein n=1 Tax=Streptomyces sp. NPDC001401 TaxID=3364570 RepID=UPI0036A25AA1